MPQSRPRLCLSLSLAAAVIGGALAAGAPAAASTGTFTQSTPITYSHVGQLDSVKDVIDTPFDIPDEGVATSEVMLEPPVDGAVVTWVDVTVWLDHPHLDDLDLVLEAPDGRATTLASDVGADSAGPRVLRYQELWATPLPHGRLEVDEVDAAPTDHDPQGDTDAYPGKAPATFRSLGGALMNGPEGQLWTLHAYDDTAGNAGSIESWDVQVYWGLPAGPGPSTVEVRGLPRNVTDVNLTLSDLDADGLRSTEVMLESPDGRYAHVLSDLNDEKALDLDLALDDQATEDIPRETYRSGVFRPRNYDGGDQSEPVGGVDTLDMDAALSVFNGGQANGTWKLWVFNESAFGTLNIGGWSLQITTEDPPVQPAPPAPPTVTPKPPVADATAPTVTGSSPEHRASRVRTDATVKISFSEAMRVSSLSRRTVKLVSKTGKRVLTTLRYRVAKNVLVVDPERRLAPGTTYRLVVTTSARDLAGNPLGTGTKVRFTTRP